MAGAAIRWSSSPEPSRERRGGESIAMRTVALADGVRVPALGQGTWMMAEDPRKRQDEIAALRAGIACGLTLIDTAEMYADGASEVLVGEAIDGLRDDVFLVGKAYPQNASRTRLRAACEASLKRLGTDRFDLYLLHWRGSVPLAETVEAMERLREAGLIARWGVSNLDTDDMTELVAAGGGGCVTDQILYNLTRRGPEHDLLPWLAGQGMATMAYSPVEQGRLIRNRALADIAHDLHATPAQVALAWTLLRDDVITIPKAGTVAHVRENVGALGVVLDAATLARLDRAFPAPTTAVPLEML
jgi:diketogulonate reductase-like aldo/keto reductase